MSKKSKLSPKDVEMLRRREAARTKREQPQPYVDEDDADRLET